jgi:alpha-D-ribose 1-methylphosphonate 5-triphosphate synthase subunit PhnI
MYVAVKGGEQAIANAERWVADQRRGDTHLPELSILQIREQLGLAVDRVLCEGSLYDPELAALAIKQAQGDLIEAIFLLRAFRTTLPRIGFSLPIDTEKMRIQRRISAIYKDVPGGQLLGPTYDYTQRLLNFDLTNDHKKQTALLGESGLFYAPSINQLLENEGLLAPEVPLSGDPDPSDLTQEALQFPANRPLRLQNLTRADEGFLLSLGYSSQRGYGNTHPFAGEIRQGWVMVEFFVEELGFEIQLGEILVTECQMINQFSGTPTLAPQFTRGYGLVFGACERKAMSMALVDRTLLAQSLGESIQSPAQMQEFVLSHSDNVEASGFVQHLKLPHYVDFQSELAMIRLLRVRFEAMNREGISPIDQKHE